MSSSINRGGSRDDFGEAAAACAVPRAWSPITSSRHYDESSKHGASGVMMGGNGRHAPPLSPGFHSGGIGALDGAGLDPVVVPGQLACPDGSVPTLSMVRILDSTVPGSPMWSVPVHRCPLSAWCASSTRRCPSSTLWSGPGGSPARMDRCPPASWCAASTRRYRARPCGRCPPSAWCASSTRRCPSSTLWSVPVHRCPLSAGCASSTRRCRARPCGRAWCIGATSGMVRILDPTVPELAHVRAFDTTPRTDEARGCSQFPHDFPSFAGAVGGGEPERAAVGASGGHRPLRR